ncbi:MAG: hypothetical protein AAGA81_07325 [Acidobacteriota bacterium]
MSSEGKRQPPLQLDFDPTPEIFASDSQGSFFFPLVKGGQELFDTSAYDEMRLSVVAWHPSDKPAIDLDRAYVELRAAFEPDPARWMKLAEIEPVVPPYQSGRSFDGWIVLPVLAAATSLAIFGGGFEPRARLQLRAHAFLVA